MSIEWTALGEAEFDRRLMPRGHKRPEPDQGALFFMAVEPVRKAAGAAEQLPGQLDLMDLFGGDDQ
jgi:hypothetical protein